MGDISEYTAKITTPEQALEAVYFAHALELLRRAACTLNLAKRGTRDYIPACVVYQQRYQQLERLAYKETNERGEG